MEKLLPIEKIENDTYVKLFKSTASEEQLKYLGSAYKILQNCSMGLLFDFTDDYHFDCLTTALIEVSKFDEDFINELANVETEDQYVALKDRIPDNEVLKYYMHDGIENLLISNF